MRVEGALHQQIRKHFSPQFQTQKFAVSFHFEGFHVHFKMKMTIPNKSHQLKATRFVTHLNN